MEHDACGKLHAARITEQRQQNQEFAFLTVSVTVLAFCRTGNFNRIKALTTPPTIEWE